MLEGGRAGLWDSDRRVRELEADGVVAEVLFPDGTENNEVPFGPFGGLRDHPAELRLAGAKAYNRWLADVCALEPARRAGVALVPLHDIDAAVAEIRWAKEAGLRGGVGLHPGDPALPLYHDARYEPIWATCAELGMPVNFHTGPGKPDYGTGDAARMLIVTEGTLFFAHRSLVVPDLGRRVRALPVAALRAHREPRRVVAVHARVARRPLHRLDVPRRAGVVAAQAE